LKKLCIGKCKEYPIPKLILVTSFSAFANVAFVYLVNLFSCFYINVFKTGYYFRINGSSNQAEIFFQIKLFIKNESTMIIIKPRVITITHM